MALNNSQYEMIIKGYEQTRDFNRHLLEGRREEVYRAISGYRELEDSVSGISAATARLMLSGDDNALNQLKFKLSQIASKKVKLLTDAGFPSDYLDPIYTCPDCQDTGFTAGHGNVKEKCRCFRQKELSVRYAQSNVQHIIQQENFSTLSYEFYQNDDLRRFKAAVNLSKKFVENFKEEDCHNIFFYGTVGTGKTFLSGCIAKELLQKGFSVIYFSSSDLFDRLAQYSFDVKYKQELQIFCDDLYSCDLLIIDDLGTERTNVFVTSQLFSCLCERELHRKSTIISSNLRPEELQNCYSDRIFSRITGNFDVCLLTGPDIRIYRKLRTISASHGTDVDT